MDHIMSPDFVFSEDVPEWLLQHYQVFLIPFMVYPIMVHMWPKSMHVDASNKVVRALLFAWNVKLAMFSVVLVYHLSPPLFTRLALQGYDMTVCLHYIDDSYLMRPYGRWVFAFVLSKIPELGDTFFLLLRDKNVPFLHWYHHLITLLFVYVQAVLLIETAEWVTWMNAVVHSFMYSYYAISVYAPNHVRGLCTLLTGLQVAQMFHGMFLTGYHIVACGNCPIKDYPGFLLYTIYACMFTKYFAQRYLPSISPSTSMKMKMKAV